MTCRWVFAGVRKWGLPLWIWSTSGWADVLNGVGASRLRQADRTEAEGHGPQRRRCAADSEDRCAGVRGQGRRCIMGLRLGCCVCWLRAAPPLTVASRPLPPQSPPADASTLPFSASSCVLAVFLCCLHASKSRVTLMLARPTSAKSDESGAGVERGRRAVCLWCCSTGLSSRDTSRRGSTWAS